MEFYVSVPLSRFESMVDDVASAGFNPEIRMTNVDFLLGLSAGDVVRMRERLDGLGLSTFTHGPFFGLDIASLDGQISRYTHEAFMKGLEVSASLGAPVMVVHTGYLPQFSRGGRRHWFRNWGERMPAVALRASEMGVILALENTWDDRPEIVWHLLEMLPHGVGVCLDTGHLNAFSRHSFERWWRILGARVVAIHLHDNDGLSDDHLVPGAGTFDFDALVVRISGSDRMPLLDLEVDLDRAPAGREYLEGLLGRALGRARRKDTDECCRS